MFFMFFMFFMRWTWLFVNFNHLWIYSHAPFKIWIILQTCADTLLSQSHLGGQDSWFGILLKHSGRGRNAKTALYCCYADDRCKTKCVTKERNGGPKRGTELLARNGKCNSIFSLHVKRYVNEKTDETERQKKQQETEEADRKCKL